MSTRFVEVHVCAIFPSSSGCVVFLGNEDMVFVIFVDESVGAAIRLFVQGTS
jgi:uncharacterized protein